MKTAEDKYLLRNIDIKPEVPNKAYDLTKAAIEALKPHSRLARLGIVVTVQSEKPNNPTYKDDPANEFAYAFATGKTRADDERALLTVKKILDEAGFKTERVHLKELRILGRQRGKKAA
jgi:hypothetical protein